MHEIFLFSYFCIYNYPKFQNVVLKRSSQAREREKRNCLVLFSGGVLSSVGLRSVCNNSVDNYQPLDYFIDI
ncbi:hypothetical protein L2E82_35580 [Cichorium intybus]|uniref:Uncharacterized protein n=1 Tax=Cichorium intybus TaxID=13427 RepID=A0ACB9BP75_CICIN|nr:hypothetical protein L2E82_35580 [Cichorium intybus]